MIQIIDCKILDKPFHKATVNIRIEKWGGFRIKRIKIFEKDNSRWISLPSEEYEKDGKKKYFALIDFDKHELNDAFKDKILKAYDDYISSLAPSARKPEVFNEEVPF